MLVLSPLNRVRGRRRFLVLPITSQGYENGKLREQVQPIGNCIDPNTSSFILLEPCRLTENMLHCSEGRSPVRRPCDRWAYNSAVKAVQDRVLHGTVSSPLGIEG